MTTLVWLHEDALRADHPAMTQAGDEAACCFVWDDEYLQRMDYGFKRLVFIYETLCELNVPVYRGDTVTVLTVVAQHMNADCLFIPATPNPELQALAKKIPAPLQVEVIDDVPFVECRKAPDLKRFFRYWNKARKDAMHPGGRRE